VPVLLTALLAVGSAVWIVGLFLIRREGDPGAELQIQLDFLGRQDGT